jgi:AcrR family transcriptional regulator
MAQVAGAAGVSRQTLYNEFGSRERLAQAFVIREAQRFIEEVEETIALHLDDPAAALAEALELVLTSASEHPLVRMLRIDDGTEGMLPLLTTQSGPVLSWATDRLAQAIARGWPKTHREDCRLLAEALVRLAISYVIAPSAQPRQASEDAVRLLSPFLARVLARDRY